MGGRGASSGVSRRKGVDGAMKTYKYGEEYKTVLQVGNIKFVKSRDPQNIHTAPMETRTKNRTYVYVNDKNQIKGIIFNGKDNLRNRTLHSDHYHIVDGVKTKIHVHMGYFHDEKGTRMATKYELKLLDRVEKIWYNHNNKKSFRG